MTQITYGRWLREHLISAACRGVLTNVGEEGRKVGRGIGEEGGGEGREMERERRVEMRGEKREKEQKMG